MSIIIPVFNAEKYLEDVLTSVLNQTYKEIEIICINDASTDMSMQVIEKYISKDKRVVCLINDVNLGVVRSRNIAIEAANGEYILPLDADDKIAKTYIEKALQIFEKTLDTGVVYAQARLFGKLNISWTLPSFNKYDMLFSNHVFCAAVFKKVDWEKYHGYKTNMKYAYEDWDFWLNFVQDNRKFYKIEEELFYYRQVEKSRTTSLSFANDILMRQQIRKNHPNLYAKPRVKESLVEVLKVRDVYNKTFSEDFSSNLQGLEELLNSLESDKFLVLYGYGLIGQLFYQFLENKKSITLVDINTTNHRVKIFHPSYMEKIKKQKTVVICAFGREEEVENYIIHELKIDNIMFVKADDFTIVEPKVFSDDLSRLFNVVKFLLENQFNDYSIYVQTTPFVYKLLQNLCLVYNLPHIRYLEQQIKDEREFSLFIQYEMNPLELIYAI